MNFLNKAFLSKENVDSQPRELEENSEDNRNNSSDVKTQIKKNNKKKKTPENKQEFDNIIKEIKEYITYKSKPYAKYINKFDSNEDLSVDFPRKAPYKQNKNLINIPLSMFSEIILEITKDIIPDEEKEDVCIALDNLFLQIDLIKKAIILVNHNGL